MNTPQSPSPEDTIRSFFQQARFRLGRLCGRFVEDPEAVVDRADELFEEMLPQLAYRDRPQHPLASALFTCTVNLAAYRALEERGVGVHDFGRALLQGLARAPIPPEPAPTAEQQAAFEAAAEASHREAREGEDVFTVLPGDGETFSHGMTVHACAIVHQYSKFGLQELVPYLCAVDDVMSDKGKQGLRRSGSLALGASCCDFRFQPGGEGKSLASQYPDAIRLGDDVSEIGVSEIGAPKGGASGEDAP